MTRSYRDRTELARDILKVCNDTPLMSDICMKANISHKPATRIVNLLIERGLVTKISTEVQNSQFKGRGLRKKYPYVLTNYKTTEAGIQLLPEADKVLRLLKP